MIRDVEEYRKAIIDMERYEYAKQMANAWINRCDTEKIEQIHHKFQEDIEDENFVNKMFLKYLQTKQEKW